MSEIRTLEWHRAKDETGVYEGSSGPAAWYRIRRGSAPSGYYGAWSLYFRGVRLDRPGTLSAAKEMAAEHWARQLAVRCQVHAGECDCIRQAPIGA